MIDIYIYKLIRKAIGLLQVFLQRTTSPNYYEMYKIAATLGSFEWLNCLTNEQINELKKEVSVFNRELKRRGLED